MARDQPHDESSETTEAHNAQPLRHQAPDDLEGRNAFQSRGLG
jgi:hypothetical protein